MPTATICSDEFQPLGRAESESLGMASLPIVVASHPLGGLKPEEVRAKADRVVEEIVHVLTDPREKLAAEYRGKYVEAKAVIKPKPIFA